MCEVHFRCNYALPVRLFDGTLGTVVRYPRGHKGVMAVLRSLGKSHLAS